MIITVDGDKVGTGKSMAEVSLSYEFAKENNIPIIGRIVYSKDFVDANLKMPFVAEMFPKYSKDF